jgi:tRNA A-37 threonylcarbamoyl transferase component Bud32
MKPLQLDKLVGVVLDEDIELHSLLGEGGMGVVYLAHQRSLRRNICVKFLHSHMVSDHVRVKRFQREARALSKLRNDHVASVYFLALYEGIYPYIAMEYVEGATLRELLQNGPLDYQRAGSIYEQLTSAMAYVHSSGLVHRDLKPDNVMLTSNDDQYDFVKLLDFGICSRDSSATFSETITESGELLGSLYYMAPECFQKTQDTATVDTYAMSCMLYEILVGNPPFDRANLAAIAYAHAKAEVPSLPAASAPEPERGLLNAFIQRGCAKHPAERFQNATQMHRAFQSVRIGDGAILKALQTGSRAGRSNGMRTAVVIALSVITLAVVINWKSVRAVGGPFIWKLWAHAYTDVTALNAAAETAYNNKYFDQAATYWEESLSFESVSPQAKIATLLHIADCQINLGCADKAGIAIIDAAENIAKRLEEETLDNSAEQVLSILFENLMQLLHSPFYDAPSSKFPSFLTVKLSPDIVTRLNPLLIKIIQKNLPPRILERRSTITLAATIAELHCRAKHYSRALQMLAGNHRDRPATIKRDLELQEKFENEVRTCTGKTERLTLLRSVLLKELPGEKKQTGDAEVYLRFLRFTQDTHLTNPRQIDQFLQLLSAITKEHYSDEATPSLWQIVELNREQLRATPQRKLLLDSLAAEHNAR